MGTKPYGFALSIDDSTLHPRLRFSRSSMIDATAVLSNGFELITRTYATTPESLTEEQPLLEPRTILAYEGRVDNRGEVAYALGAPELAHAPDGVVLVAAHQAWGSRLSAHVLGEFAYVAFDRDNATIVAGQDSMGVRRLYYRKSGDRVWVASDLRLLFELFPAARPSLDPEILPEYFSGVMEPWSGRTIWRGIRELARGSALLVSGKMLEEHTVWRPDPEQRFKFRDTVECDATVRRTVFQGVAAALRANGPVLCDLSGGYDSSTVCSVATRLARSGTTPAPRLIAWASQNERSDESEFRDAVARECGFAPYLVEMRTHLPFRVFSDVEIPTLGVLQHSALENTLRAFAESHGIRTRLTGGGADALFHKGSSPNYLGDWLRAGRFLDWMRDFQAYLRSGHYSAWHLLRDCTLGSLDMQAGMARRPLPNWLLPRFRRAMREVEHKLYHQRPRVFPSAARELVYRWTLLFVRPHGYLLSDERSPLVYRPLVELMLGLDWENLVRPNEDRVVMRRAFRGILPPAFVTRAGTAEHFAPIYAGLRANWPRVKHLISGERLAELGVVDLRLFREALNAMRAGHPGQGDNAAVSITALYLETWLNLKSGQDNATMYLSTAES
jgi:asparagine synthase (glutamine-hydrolysing)